MFFRALAAIESVAQKLQGKGYGATSIEAEVAAAVRFLPKSGAVVFDVGGNRGCWAREMLRRANSRVSTLYCFEPSRHNHQAIESIADPRVILVKRALAEDVGESTLYFDEIGSGMASLVKRRLDHFHTKVDGTELVSITTLDTAVAEFGISRIDFAKFDIEGFEYKAFQGGRRSFDSGVIRALAFEFGGCNIDTRTYFQDFWYFLRERNFRIALINPVGKPFEILRYSESLEHFRTTNYVAWKAG